MKKQRTRILTKTVVLTDRVCLVCKKKFEGWGKQTFCSKLCSNKAVYARHAEEYRANRREKYQAAKTTAQKK